MNIKNYVLCKRIYHIYDKLVINVKLIGKITYD